MFDGELADEVKQRRIQWCRQVIGGERVGTIFEIYVMTVAACWRVINDEDGREDLVPCSCGNSGGACLFSKSNPPQEENGDPYPGDAWQSFPSSCIHRPGPSSVPRL